MDTLKLEGWFADFDSKEFFFGTLSADGGRVAGIRETGSKRMGWSERSVCRPIILPGLIDAHVHIESSMLMPSRFAAMAVKYGTVATVSDPHEIANVLGLDGIRLMMEDADKACLKIHFTAPSCVPATSLESAGAELSAADMEILFLDNQVSALGEMMNYPGVLSADPGVMDKIFLARKYGKPVDGHAPGLTGNQLDSYIGAGISTDHECSTIEEAEEKLAGGMKILIREGSSARNFGQLYPLIDRYPEMVMLCSDDYHPDDLMKGHIDRLIRRGLHLGLDFFNLYRTAAINPVDHYNLRSGLLRPGDPADFIVIGSLEPFTVAATYINGIPVYKDGKVNASLPELRPLNAFFADPVNPVDLEVKGLTGLYRVIRAWEGELLTGSETARLEATDGIVEGDLKHDILKIVVLNRYRKSKPAVAWISGFGLKSGALASSIAHDSHNIIAVGTSDLEIAAALNLVIHLKGGIAVTRSGISEAIPLPVAGLMSMDTAIEVGSQYGSLNDFARKLGPVMEAPFMTLSFMALLVIPHLKIGDRGLFNCDTFEFTDLKAD